MAEAEVFIYWQRQRLAEAEVEKPHAYFNSSNSTEIASLMSHCTDLTGSCQISPTG